MDPFGTIRETLEGLGENTTDALCEGGVSYVYCEVREILEKTIQQ